MKRLILVLLLGCLSFAAYGQDKKSKTKRRNKVEQNIEANSSNQRREIKYILHNPRLSNTRLSEFYNLDVTDIPKNYKRILRSHPCWKVTRFAYANIYDDEYYIEKDIYGGEEYPYHNTFAFFRKGDIRPHTLTKKATHLPYNRATKEDEDVEKESKRTNFTFPRSG